MNRGCGHSVPVHERKVYLAILRGWFVPINVVANAFFHHADSTLSINLRFCSFFPLNLLMFILYRRAYLLFCGTPVYVERRSISNQVGERQARRVAWGIRWVVNVSLPFKYFLLVWHKPVTHDTNWQVWPTRSTNLGSAILRSRLSRRAHHPNTKYMSKANELAVTIVRTKCTSRHHHARTHISWPLQTRCMTLLLSRALEILPKTRAIIPFLPDVFEIS